MEATVEERFAEIRRHLKEARLTEFDAVWEDVEWLMCQVRFCMLVFQELEDKLVRVSPTPSNIVVLPVRRLHD